jgi:hypothetical protein
MATKQFNKKRAGFNLVVTAPLVILSLAGSAKADDDGHEDD